MLASSKRSNIAVVIVDNKFIEVYHLSHLWAYNFRLENIDMKGNLWSNIAISIFSEESLHIFLEVTNIPKLQRIAPLNYKMKRN